MVKKQNIFLKALRYHLWIFKVVLYGNGHKHFDSFEIYDNSHPVEPYNNIGLSKYPRTKEDLHKSLCFIEAMDIDTINAETSNAQQNIILIIIQTKD